jgi:hypothetical protein
MAPLWPFALRPFAIRDGRRAARRCLADKEEHPMTDPEKTRTSSSNPSTNPLFQNTELEQFARFLTTSLAEAFRQSNDQPQRRVQHLRASDLPQLKGDSLDGGDAETFLTKLDTTFKLASTPEEDQVHSASQASPGRSTAHAWFEEQKAQDTFTDD